MNLMPFPLRQQAGRIVFLRLEQLPAAQRARTTCPFGSADSGWRIKAEPCEDSPFFHHLNAVWQRLACATHTPRMLADLLLIRRLLPSDGSFNASPLPHRWCGRDVRPWLSDPAAFQDLLRQLAIHQRESRFLLCSPALAAMAAATAHPMERVA